MYKLHILLYFFISPYDVESYPLNYGFEINCILRSIYTITSVLWLMGIFKVIQNIYKFKDLPNI